MRQMRKKIIIAIIVTLLLTAGIAFAIGTIVIKGKDEKISELQVQAVDTSCLAFKNDLKENSIITQDDLTEIKIQLGSLSAGTYVVDGDFVKHMIVDEEGTLIESEVEADLEMTKEDFVGRVVKSNVTKNTIVSDSLLYVKGEEPTKDERIQEFNFIQIPSDVNTNDYIDIRIQFPTGEDYSVLIGKKVEKIAGENTIFIKMNEEEIMAMGSAIIEAYMQDGVRLYANKYTDPATQLFNEAIVDYVAKYEYAAEKLTKEKQELALRKTIAEMLKDSMVAVDPTLGLPANVVGVHKYTIEPGDTIIENGDEVQIAEARIIDLYIEKNEEKELLLTADSMKLVSNNLRKQAVSTNPESQEIDIKDLKNDILAGYAGIKEEYVEEIKLATAEKNEAILSYYKKMKVVTRDEIIRSYPVKEEVLAVIKANPNLLTTVIAEFDTRALTNTRIDEYKILEAQYNAAFDEYTKEQIKQKMDELVSTRVGNVEKNIEEEVAAQRAERVSYLESLIESSTVEE